MKKIGRNDPCHCGSGKKFKKCCESSMIGGRFVASKVNATSAPQVASAPKLTGLFHSRVSQISQPSDATRTIHVTPPPSSENSTENTLPPTEEKKLS